MSDITASPAPSFDEGDERIHKPEPASHIHQQEQHKEVQLKRVSCQSRDEDLTPPSAQMKLTINTNSTNFNQYIKEEPKIGRASEKTLSKFDWKDEDVVLRTVSPLKPKEKNCKTIEDEDRALSEETSSRIWRKKSEGVTRTIAKNVSNTFSEQGGFQYS